MDRFPEFDHLVTAKVETTEGEDATPTPADDAVRVESPNFDPQGDSDGGENEVTNSLDAGEPVPHGIRGNATFDNRVRGPGTDNAGTAPEVGTLYRGCAMSELLIAADVTGTAVSGGASSIELAVGDGANVAVGQPISITSGAGAGQTRVILSLDGDNASVTPAWDTPPDMTSQYTAPACALYAPVSEDLETLSLYHYENAHKSATDSTLRKLLGAMGTFTINVTTGQVVRQSFTFMGKSVDPADVTRPTGAAFNPGAPVAFRGADFFLGDLAVQMSTFSLDAGVRTSLPPDPAADDGFDVAGVGRRVMGGELVVMKRTIADLDAVSDFKNATGKPLWARWGGSAGRRVSLLLPDVRHIRPAGRQAVEGFGAETMGYRANGIDNGAHLCFY